MIRHVGRHRVLRTGTWRGLTSTTIQDINRRCYASVTALDGYPEPGERLHGFTLKEKKHVPELHLTGLRLEHDATGAEYLHVAREDKNNVFAINFQTNPVDRTGLPHILEHVTLCGSEKYPVRDPFFKMMPRSLANFMNAFTSSNYTSYPFATTNYQDFRNLAAVYLDATLHPLLKRTDFLQEGWRLGPEDPNALATHENTIFKGVVYNEMKGQMSDSSYLYYIRFREHMFPALENSGGDPDQMTKLKYEELVKYSKEHYHPSNAKIFTYGNMPLVDHLKQVNEVISKFSRIERDLDPKGPIDLSQGPIHYSVEGPLDTMQPPDRQTKSSVTWLGCPSSDLVESFSLSIMLSLLTDGYGSPLYQGLIETGLGTTFTANSGYDAGATQSIISIGLDGMKADEAAKLKDHIQNVLREKAHEAFQPHKVEGYMHQLEIALKHKTANFGMGMLNKTLPAWFNGTSPMDNLAWDEVVNAFKHRQASGKFLEGLLDKYLLNDKCMQFTMHPSDSYNTQLEASEQQRRTTILESEIASAGNPEKAFSQLSQQELELLAEQEASQEKNLETLPTLRVGDIPQQKERKPVRWGTIGSSRALWRETDTNGVTYFEARHVLQGLPNELRLLLPLFTETLMRLGTKKMSVGDLEAEILRKTGGISVSPFTAPSAIDDAMFNEGLSFGGYALDRNVPAMLDLLKTVLLDVDFTAPHVAAAILELLESKASGALDSVAETGHSFAISAAAAALDPRWQKQEQLQGLTQIENTSRLLKAARADPLSLQEVIQQLQLIQEIAVSGSSSLSFRTVCEASSVTENEKLIHNFLRGLPDASAARTTNFRAEQVPGSTFSRRTFFNMPFQVSYTGTCLKTVPYASPDKAPLTILGHLLRDTFLLREVREKGGAYGTSASASSISSLFTMMSYRDPNPSNSLATFRRVGQYASEKAWTQRELEEAKLSLFQQVDAPKSVKGEGSAEFWYGITEEMDQSRREQLLGVTKDDVQRVAQKYLVDVPDPDLAVAVLGEKKSWVSEDTTWSVRSLNVSA